MVESLLFEKPITLAALWGAVVLVSLVVWRQRRTRGSSRWFVGVLLAWPILIGVSLLVVTSRERIVRICHNMARSVQAGDAAAIAAHMDDVLDAEGLDRDAFMQHVERTLERMKFENLRLRQVEVTFDDPVTGTALFNAVCGVRSTEINHPHIISRWRVTFKLRDRDWLVILIEAVPTPFSPIRSLRQTF